MLGVRNSEKVWSFRSEMSLLNQSQTKETLLSVVLLQVLLDLWHALIFILNLLDLTQTQQNQLIFLQRACQYLKQY